MQSWFVGVQAPAARSSGSRRRRVVPVRAGKGTSGHRSLSVERHCPSTRRAAASDASAGVGCGESLLVLETLSSRWNSARTECMQDWEPEDLILDAPVFE